MGIGIGLVIGIVVYVLLVGLLLLFNYHAHGGKEHHFNEEETLDIIEKKSKDSVKPFDKDYIL